MVKHIVLFRLKTISDNEEKQAQLKEMQEIFSSIPGELEYITEYRTGCNVTKADHAWDFVIDSVFRNLDDLQIYQESEVHRNAVKRAAHIGKVKAVVDYEF